jgi:hypothetical protein
MTDKQRIWAERYLQWKASGKTLQEFAKEQPYNGLTLKWWGSELRRRGLLDKAGSGRQRRGQRQRQKSDPASAIRLARVVRREEPRAGGAGIVVEFGRARVVVERNVDAVVLSTVLRALEEAR